MSGVTANILSVIFMVLLNGVFAMSEMAVVSARKARLQHMIDRGNTKAKAALELARAPNRFLSTVQIGITLVGILAGAFGGATIAKAIAEVLERISFLAPYSEGLSLLLVVICTTYLSLVIGELVPKRIALNNPERIATMVARPMRILSILAAPVVKLLGLSTEFILNIVGITLSDAPPITEEELKILLHEGTLAGVFEEAEQDMVQNVFRLNDWRIESLMTPRTEVIWLNIEEPQEEIWRKIMESPHSRFPVCDGDLDNLLGIMWVKDLLTYEKSEQLDNIKNILQEPIFVPESITVSRVLEIFKHAKTDMAIVLDEYSGIQGVVTLTDLLEAIIGEIQLFGQSSEPQALQREDGSWLLDGFLHIDEVKELLDIDQLPGEERYEYQTLAGFIMSRMDRIPTSGQYFAWGNWRFEVVDMDGFRVDKVLVTSQPDIKSQEANIDG